jgi:hypothetical protein
MIRIGDIIQIPLSNQRNAFGQYVYNDKVMGPLLQIYKPTLNDDFDLDLLRKINWLFPPIITGLHWAVRQGMWTVIDRAKVSEFSYPKFIRTLYDEKTGKASVWYLWEGKESIRLGPKLSREYRKLEYLVVWSPFDIVERIETGVYPYPYGDLIKHNRFTPRTENTNPNKSTERPNKLQVE